MRLLDDGVSAGFDALRELYPDTGRARIVGVTGSPGSGKSTLVDQLVRVWRDRGLTVGVVAIDPTSPFSGGAILGDRIRMRQHEADDGVFVRSLATRGNLGGLSRSTRDVVAVMDAMGMDRIVIETVGVGQDEVDIVGTAHTSLVVLVPGMGDDIQAIKAGILEIADIFVLNKADHEGVDRAEREIRAMIELGGDLDGWKPPIVRTIASSGEGVLNLADAVDDHLRWLDETGRFEDRVRRARVHHVRQALRDRFERRLDRAITEQTGIAGLIDAAASGEQDPYSVADAVLAELSVG
ncbi:MAG: methylmalonyl Co-A mutase-associated GTPase MeaB [Candidatus Dadabacteria bacterium]|nr:MAG: methylmalonyl Co-A mutase-associated GTPase MeaB [Candidatus Dadabacteria bacterium]